MEYDRASMREARARLAELLDAAEEGSVTLITRHGRTAAAIVPVELLDQLGQPGPAIEDAAYALRGALRAIEPMLPEPTATWSAQQSRPGRPVLVIDSLASLRGPVRGAVELPLQLFWSASDRSFDLGKPYMARSMYETVLGEAASARDLADWLDRDTLIRLWPDLFLPRPVRRAWEERHPVLGTAAERVA